MNDRVHQEIREAWVAHLEAGPFSNDDRAARAVVFRMASTTEQVRNLISAETPPYVVEFVSGMGELYDHVPTADDIWQGFLGRVLLWLNERDA